MMQMRRQSLIAALAAVIAISAACQPAAAQESDLFVAAKGGKSGGTPGGGKGGGKPGSGGGDTGGGGTIFYSWMQPDIQGAWDAGFNGAGVSMTFVDDFSSTSRFTANLGDGSYTLRHGQWTSKEGGMVAPGATIIADDFYIETPVALQAGFNVLNLSYGFVEYSDLYDPGWMNDFPQEQSIIQAAWDGTAFISKSAGNEGWIVGEPSFWDGSLDFLGYELIGAPAAIFVGAADWNGSPQNPTVLSYYSNLPLFNETVQNQFLVVGVEYDKTGLAGTSFAAPIVSGYAAIISNKFPSATPVQVANQLLNTARTDTILDYDPLYYGRGEASLSNALAPQSIN